MKDKKEAKATKKGRKDKGPNARVEYGDEDAVRPMMKITVSKGDELVTLEMDPEQALKMRNALDGFISFVREHGYMIVED